jgi:hypothetical protein
LQLAAPSIRSRAGAGDFGTGWFGATYLATWILGEPLWQRAFVRYRVDVQGVGANAAHSVLPASRALDAPADRRTDNVR